MNPTLTFGQRLRIARRSVKLSIADAASLRNVSVRLWKYWEADEKIPPTDAEANTQESLFRFFDRVKAVSKVDPGHS